MGLKYCDTSALAYRYPLLLRHTLRFAVENAPGQLIVHAGRRYTYRAVATRIERLGAALSGLGVREGTMVAVMDWDSHRYLECFFAVPMLGAVLMTVNVRLSVEQIAYTLQHSGAEVLLIHEDFEPMVAQILRAVPGLRRTVWLTDTGSRAPKWSQMTGEYEDLLHAQSAPYDWRDFDENAMAVQFYTTGTTGVPKAVAFSHRQIVLKVLVFCAAWASQSPGQAFRQGDVYMPITPLFHVQAWAFPYVAMLLGVKHVYPGKYETAKLLRLRREEEVSYSHCVPTLLEMILRAPESARTDLSGWKICVGGASLTPALAAEALERGIDVFAGYGLSETYAGTLLTGFRGDPALYNGVRQLDVRCKAGRAIPLVDLRVVDEEMCDVPRDDRSIGEIVVRMPWAVGGYEGMPAESDDLWRGGYLHTQDLGRWDDDGYVTIVDRMKDVIKSGGEWISSLDLERLISRHPDVAEVAVIPMPDRRWGERPVALVVPKAESSRDLPAQVKHYLIEMVAEGHISRFAVPERIELVPLLEKTSVGKIDKKALRARFVS